jgi:hypothetical protein
MNLAALAFARACTDVKRIGLTFGAITPNELTDRERNYWSLMHTAEA